MWNADYKLGIFIVILKESLDKLHVTSTESIHCLFVPKGNELNELSDTIHRQCNNKNLLQKCKQCVIPPLFFN